MKIKEELETRIIELSSDLLQRMAISALLHKDYVRNKKEADDFIRSYNCSIEALALCRLYNSRFPGNKDFNDYEKELTETIEFYREEISRKLCK